MTDTKLARQHGLLLHDGDVGPQLGGLLGRESAFRPSYTSCPLAAVMPFLRMREHSNSAKTPIPLSSSDMAESSPIKVIPPLHPYTFVSEAADQGAQVVEVAGQLIHAVDSRRIPIAHEAQQLLELKPDGSFTAGVVGEDPVQIQAIQLAGGVLISAADAGIIETLTARWSGIDTRTNAGCSQPGRLALDAAA